MASQNIQYLFSVIRPVQVKSYLGKQGWTCQENDGRLDFESAPNAEGDVRRLSLPAEHSHPRFRKLIPNLIFSLAVANQEEAIDIANAIASESAPATVANQNPTATTPQLPAASTPPALPMQAAPDWSLVLSNGHADQAILLRNQATQSEVSIAAGDAVRIVGTAKASCKLQVTADCSLKFLGEPAPQLFYDLPDTKQKATRENLTEQLSSLFTEWLSSPVGPAVSNSLARFDFHLGRHNLTSSPDVLKAALAILLVEARQALKDVLPYNQQTERLLKLARVVLGVGNYLILTEGQPEKSLAAVLDADSAVAPHNTLRWLDSNSRPIS